jgi:UDP-N-acetylglucosamine 4-epimerase
MLVAARDEKVKRFIYAASSSTYGDSVELPKVEDNIGNPLSPYAITKYVNELYADVFARTYGIEAVGLRYFNVFGKNQDPNGAYAAVIPLWVKKMMDHESPVINGDENYSRDFTYIDNVVQANEKAMAAPAGALKTKEKKYVHQVFNVAFGSNTKLIELFTALRDNLAIHDPAIRKIQPIIGPFRDGDIPHSQASIAKAKKMINYQPKYNAQQGFELVSEWYYKNLR